MTNLKPPMSAWPYGLAAISVGLATGLTWLFFPFLERTVFLLFFAAVIISSRYGGFGSGTLAAVLSAMAGFYFFLPPLASWRLDDVEGVVQVSLFLLIALLISYLTETRQQAVTALRTSEARFRAIIDNAPALIYLKALDGRYLLINRHYEQMFGLSRHQVEGKTDYDLFTPELADVFRTNDQQVAEAGQAMEFEEMTPYPDGLRTSMSIKFPLYDISGMLYGTCGISTDIHERKRAELAQRLLAEAGKILSSSLELPVQLSNVAWLAVPDLADWCAVNLYDEDWTTHHIAVAHVDPAKVTLAQELQYRYPADQEELAQGIHPWQHGQSQLFTEISEGLLKEGARDADHYQILRSLNMRSAMVTPLVARERVLGVMVFVWAESGKRYDAQDLALAEELARRAAIAIDNTRAYEAEQEARAEAEAAQQRLALLAEMRERNRLAQELHDTVAQALGYLNLKISATHKLLADEQFDSAKTNLQELKQVVGETYTDVREEIFYLRSKTLSDLSFMELLTRYVEKYRRFYTLDIQLIQEADPALFEFPAAVTSQLVRTIQEALINVRKHAQVNQVIIRLGQENEQLRISIEDEGQGFDRAKIQEKRSSFGLQIMRERVESVGGVLEVDTAPGRGTRVVLLYRKQEPEQIIRKESK